MWRIIVITPEHPIDGEAEALARLVNGGASAIHLRHPSHISSYYEILEALPEFVRERIYVHNDHSEQIRSMVGGLHYNSKLTYSGQISKIKKSISCHGISELRQLRDKGWTENFDHIFLSPIFDSISKKGYRAAYTEDELIDAKNDGLINDRIIALGGVTSTNIDIVKSLGFGGAALLGSIWKDGSAQVDESSLTPYF